jgi:hypothetical protein
VLGQLCETIISEWSVRCVFKAPSRREEPCVVTLEADREAWNEDCDDRTVAEVVSDIEFLSVSRSGEASRRLRGTRLSTPGLSLSRTVRWSSLRTEP